jgi:hypothetical protein
MFHVHNLRSRIQEWRNRLYRSNYNTINNEFVLFWKKMHAEPMVQAILKQVILLHPLTGDKRAETYKQMLDDANWFEFSEHTHQAAMVYHMQMEALEQKSSINSVVFDVYHSNDFDTSRDKFVEMMVHPIIDFINDQLDEANLVLYLLEKYKRRVEWFTHGELLARFMSHEGIKEDIFDADLRRYLFDQGVDYPFSKPRTSTGDADIVGMIDANNPLIVEVKYYDGGDYKKNRILKGFTQIVNYTEQYNKNIGYLVVFNLTAVQINIESDDNTNQFPARVNFNNKDYYIVIVGLNFDKSASTLGKLKAEKVTKTELITELEPPKVN